MSFTFLKWSTSSSTSDSGRVDAARARELLLGEVDEGAAVEGAGERVERGELLREVVGALLLHEQERHRRDEDHRVVGHEADGLDGRRREESLDRGRGEERARRARSAKARRRRSRSSRRRGRCVPRLTPSHGLPGQRDERRPGSRRRGSSPRPGVRRSRGRARPRRRPRRRRRRRGRTRAACAPRKARIAAAASENETADERRWRRRSRPSRESRPGRRTARRRAPARGARAIHGPSPPCRRRPVPTQSETARTRLVATITTKRERMSNMAPDYAARRRGPAVSRITLRVNGG